VTRAALRARPVHVLALVGLLMLGLVSALPLSAPAATSVVFTPTDDTFAHSEYPSTTHGSLIEFRVDGSPVLNGFLRFDVSGLTGPVTRATLKLYSRTSHSGGFEVRSVSSSGWTEATLTYANAPASSTTVTGRSGAIAGGTWAAVDVTSVVAGNGTVEFALTTTSVTNLPLGAKEIGAEKAPQLVVETSASSSGSTAPSTTGPSTTTTAPTTTTTTTPTTTTTTTPTTTGTTTTSSPPDTSPPTTPTGVTATGATTTSVSLAWNASSDNVGATGYSVYVDGNLAGSTSQRTFTASGLSCGTTYVVTVDAYDAAGNRSAKSSPLTTATSACPDTQSPTTPGNLRATAATTSSVDLAWNASTDNVGVTGYDVYRDGSFVASTGATSYSFGGLSCGTSYAFGVEAVDAAGNRSARSTLTTPTAACPPPTSGDPVVAVAGDIAGDGSGDSATAAVLDGLSPTAVLTAGDNAYPDGTLSEYNAYYEPTWGRFKLKTYPSPGNHEYHTSGASGYFSYFGSRAGPSGKGFYSYNLGAWHLISLNSEVARGATSEQVTWLKNDLASTSARCVMAYWHKPRFTAGNYSDDSSFQPFWDALYAANADVVINGHDHNYQRYVPMTPTGARDDARGIREFVVGTGGRSHYGLRADSRREAADSSSYGVLKLTLRASGYDWQFLPEAGRTYTDSGTGTCH
jgi:chitodextrinase